MAPDVALESLTDGEDRMMIDFLIRPAWQCGPPAGFDAAARRVDGHPARQKSNVLGGGSRAYAAR